MSGLKDIVKGGWHPEKDVPLKDSFKGLVGKGKKEERTYHTATPITSLRDPASFPPPPKHVGAGASPSPPPGQPYRPQAAGASHQGYNSTHATNTQPAEEEPPTPKPYRVDTTGLSTAHLPPPPRRTGGSVASTPSPPPAYAPAKPAPPSLPPRLPPRTSTPTSPAHPPPPPARSSQPEPKPQGYLNQSAVNNLSAKGISVPGFGIRSATQTPPSTAPSQTAAQAPASGTTWAQKRAALQTASSLHKDPSSVSASDAASAASTLNNFHQRHGDQISSVAGKVNAFTAGGRTATPNHPPPPSTTTSSAPGTGAGPVVGKKKPPPPPPAAKKPALAATHGQPRQDDDAPPPPVPLATRPRF